MRLRAGQRRRLEELIHATGDVAAAAVLPWVRHWRSIGAYEVLKFLAQTGGNVAEAIAQAEQVPGDQTFAECRHAYLLEELLAVTQSRDRRHRGVYFTPPEIVRYIVRTVDQNLIERLKLPEGLASAEVRILDPAAGSGVFLAAGIRAVHARMFRNWQSRSYTAASWKEYVSRQLLPRLTGWEILPAGVVAAHCVLAETLRETGYDFHDATRLQIELRDALAPPEEERRFNVVIGNPPYASLSTARHGWIEGLMQSPEGGYMTVNGRPLGETKHWLHDDYVKFLRLAQWHIEQSGGGVVGMVTNHGYLESASFRGMRASLLKTFPHIEIVDLHGNAKMRERSPDGSRDENVFGIASGAAIGIFVWSEQSDRSHQVRRADLWGSRAGKLRKLSGESIAMAALAPAEPQYIFSPVRQTCPTYESAWRLCDAMPLSTTAPVTARDHFVIAFTHEELLERVEAFRNRSIPDDVIRQRYFTRTRSSKYAPGDSRHWKLPAARRKLAEDHAWRDRIQLCQYRPLDYRYVLWHDALIDWPRREVLRHLLGHANVALIARRQSPGGLPANFFWATQSLALDGVIRSDNRGSESLFPLWRYDEEKKPQANFALEFVEAFERALGLRFVDRYQRVDDNADIRDFTPLSLAGYLYGRFWSADYRDRYQAELSTDFPRILPPRGAASFFEVSRSGLRLLRWHTRPPAANHPEALPGDWLVAPGFPRWQEGWVWINAQTAIAAISAEAWKLRIGAHQVARKWLLDRRGRRLLPAEIAEYRSVVEMLLYSTEAIALVS